MKFTITPALKAALQRRSAEEGVSTQAFVRRVLADEVDGERRVGRCPAAPASRRPVSGRLMVAVATISNCASTSATQWCLLPFRKHRRMVPS